MMNTKADVVEEKIELLHDFGVLQSNFTIQDASIRTILTMCKSDIRMEQKLHNVLHGKETLKYLIEREEIKMRKAVFTIDGFEYPHIGYTLGDTWNGWATPYFEVDEAMKIMEEFNACEPEFPITYNKETDTFEVEEIGGGNGDEWKGYNYQTEKGIKHLYGIGAYSWVWEITTQDDIENVAVVIEDFLWELDTYEHRDQYDNREELVKDIVKQLQDFKTLKQVLTCLYTEDLNEQELFERLGKELRI